MATKTKETMEQKTARLKLETEAAKKKAEETRKLREARAEQIRAKAGLLKERLTPSPVVGQVLRKGASETGKAVSAAAQAFSELRKTPEWQKTTAVIGRAIRTAAATPLSETYLTLVRAPRGYDLVYSTLESAFGYGTFTNLQALPIVAAALGSDQSTARLRLRVLYFSGNIAIVPVVELRTQPVVNIWS